MSTLFGKSPKSKQPSAALGLDLQTAEYGKVLPVAFGRNKWAGTVIWYGQFKAIKHTEKPAGGKGAGSQKTVRYTYTSSYMVAMCEGVATPVNCFDGAAVQSLAAAGGVSFSGALGQAAWSNLAGAEILGYSGTSVIAFKDKQLGDQPSLPQLSFEMAGRNQLNPGGGVFDADPADIATAVCTDAGIGVGFTALGSLTSWSNYCRAAGLLFSPVYDTQQPALQVLSELLKYSNTEGWFSEGVLKVKPRGDRALTGNGVTFTPDLTPVAALGPNDLITNGSSPPVSIKRKSPADAMNVVRIEHRERSQKYRTIPATATIDEDMVNTGVRAETSETVDMIATSAVGQLVADNMVQRDFYVRNEFDFKLSWRYCYLEPMDIVTLTDAATGLNAAPVRILRISEDSYGLLKVEAEEMPEGIGHASFLSPQSAAGIGVDPETDPGPVSTPYIFRAPNALVSVGQPEVWVAVAGDNPLWAGCDVYLSRNGSSYTYHSTFARESTYGVTTNTLGVTADPYTAGSLNVQLYGGKTLLGCTATECDEFVTLSMLDDELISYQAATLAAGPSYNLGTRIRRGGYGSAIASHAVGAKFVRLDEDILRIAIDPSQVGTTIYVKFVSLNCFGRGGRTLADETAYAYVIGTRSDFPDVAPTPTGFTVTGVADGVNLKWTNPVPQAVGATSIEFATAVGGPFTVLGQAGPTETSFHHAFPTGATYFYRLRARGFTISGGWSGYTSVQTATGTNVEGNFAAALEVYNPGWEQDLLGWTDAIGAGLAGWYTQSPGYSGSKCLVKFGGVSGNSGIVNSGTMMSVAPGQQIAVTLVANSQYTNGTLDFGLACYDSAGTYLVNAADWNTGVFSAADCNLVYKKLRKVFTVPANAVGARFCVAVQGHTGGAWQFDSAKVEFLASSLDEVPNGATYARMFGTYLQGGAPFQLSFGDNMVQNGRFEDATYSLALGSHAASSNLCPGWIVAGVGSDLQVGIEANTVFTASARSIYFRNAGGATLAHTALSFGAVQTKQRYPVQPGDRYILTCRYDLTFANARPTNVGTEADFGVYYFDKDNAYIGADVVGVSGGTQAASNVSSVEPVSLPFTVPANAATFAVVLRAYVANNTGSSYVTAAGLLQARFDDITCRKVDLASAGAGNHLRNTDFNNGLTHWFNFTSKFDNDVEGNQIRVGSVADGAFAFPYQDVDGGWDVGSYVTFSGAAIQIGGVLAQGSRYQPYVQFYNGGSLISTQYGANILPGTTAALSFTKFAKTARIPASTTRVRVGFVIEGPQTLFAMIQPKLEKGPYATPYVTGSDGTYAQGLVNAGSGRRIGDQRNLVQSLTTAYGSVRTATALSATSGGAVSVNAHAVRYGSNSVTYNAVSNAVTGLTQGVTYIIYCTDSAYEGGTRTYSAGTVAGDVMNLGDGIVIVGQITIPASGSSSGGGSGVGGVGTCVAADMVLPDGRVAGDIQAGEMIPCWNDNADSPGIQHLAVESNELHPDTPSVTIETASGARVTASISTPMTLRDGTITTIPDMLGREALVRHEDGALVWEAVVFVSEVVNRTVAKVKVHQRCYFAGDTAGATIATHNPIAKP